MSTTIRDLQRGTAIDTPLETLLAAPPDHVEILRDLDGTHVAVPVSNYGQHNALRALGASIATSAVIVAMWVVAVFGVGYLFGQMPARYEPIQVYSPSGVALLVTASVQIPAILYIFPRLLIWVERVPTWTLSLRPNTLVVDGRTISYGEIQDITHSSAGGLTLRLDNGERFRLAQQVILTETERTPVAWLHRVLLAAIQQYKAPQGTTADVPDPLTRLKEQ